MKTITKNPHRAWRWPLMVGALALGCFIFYPSSADAKRASKRVMTVSQPGGVELKIQKFGDEYGHYTLTEDGIPVINKNGVYYYAVEGENNYPKASNIEALPAALRTPLHKQFLAGTQIENLKAQMKQYRTPAHKPHSPINLVKPETRGPGLSSTTFPAHGEQKGLAILVEFKDKRFSTPNVKDYFTRMLNEENFSDNGGTGSARDYFIQNSNGTFIPEFDVFGPVVLPQRMSYYGGNDYWGNDKNPEQMVLDACKLLDGEINFADYDRNNDGKVDNVYIFYAGYGEADYDDENTVWPHSWDISQSSTGTIIVDGKSIDHYACSNELDGKSSKPDGIGTFVHEFSHVLGLPDLYCTEEVRNEPYTPGEYSVLDYGPYNNNGRTPPNYGAYERYALDWMTPITIDHTQWIDLPPITTNTAYLVKTDKNQEYYLLENRVLEGFDKYIPWNGMLVWHIDVQQSVFDNNTVNNLKSHQYVDLIEADNIQTDGSNQGDPFPGRSYVTEFTFDTNPSFKSWSGKSVGYGLLDIEELEDGKIRFLALKDGDDRPAAVESIGQTHAEPYMNGRNLCLGNIDGSVDVFDIAGRLVTRTNGGHDVQMPSAGLYIVKCHNKAYKLLAK